MLCSDNEVCGVCLRRRSVCNCRVVDTDKVKSAADSLSKMADDAIDLAEKINSDLEHANDHNTIILRQNERLQDRVEELCNFCQEADIKFRDAMRLVHHLTKPYVDND